MEALLVIFGFAGLIWGAALLIRGGLMAGCLAIMLAGSCFGPFFFSLPTGALPLTSDRLLLVVVVGQYLVYRRFGLADPKPLRAADWVLLAFIFTLVVSTLTHDWRANKAQSLARLVFYYLMPLAIYWVGRQMRLNEQGILWLFGFLTVFGVYLGITGVAEDRGWSWLVFPKYIASETFGEFFGRARGPFLNPAGLGVYMATTLSATLLWWPRCGRLGRAGLLMLVLIMSAGVYSTLTRSVWMGAGASLLVVLGLSLPKQLRVMTLSGVMIASVLLVALQWDNLLAFKRDKALSSAEVAESAKLRPLLAMIAWQMFQDQPLVGCGFGHYAEAARPYFSDRSIDMPLEKARPYIQHNIFLSLLTETGLIGAGLFTLMLALWSLAAWRLWRAQRAPLWVRQQGLLFLAMLASFLVNGMFHDLTLMPMLNMLLFFLAGVTMGLQPSTDRQRGVSAPDRRGARALQPVN